MPYLAYQQAQESEDWSARLGPFPKATSPCYYCQSSNPKWIGKCAQDSPYPGTGKDYMGEACGICGGSGVCSHCGGSGVLRFPSRHWSPSHSAA